MITGINYIGAMSDTLHMEPKPFQTHNNMQTTFPKLHGSNTSSELSQLRVVVSTRMPGTGFI